MSGSAHGGSDILIAGTQTAGSTVFNNMWGDAQSMAATAIGGNDRFVFKDNVKMGQTVGTNNTIGDFNNTAQHDQIEFSHVRGVNSFTDLVITQSGANTVVTAR